METDERLSFEDYIAEIEQRLRTFENSLPRQLDPVALSRSKLPFKALAYRETLIWRVTELGRAALENITLNRLAAAILLTRAVVETTAALWYLHTKLEATIKAGEVGDIDKYLVRLAVGTRNWKEGDHPFPDAINVLTFIDNADQAFDGQFRKAYDSLSEYSHPNYLGTTGLYSTIDHAEILIDFGPNEAKLKNVKYICALNLSIPLMLFEYKYEKVGALMTAFIALCEAV